MAWQLMVTRFRETCSKIPVKMSPFLWFMVVLQLYYLYEVFVTDDVGGFSFRFSTLFFILWSQFTVVFFFSLVGGLFKHRLSYVVSQFVVLALYTVLVAYHFGSNEPFDIAVMIDNFSIAFSENALEVMWYSLDTYALSFLPKIVGVFLVFEWWKKAVSKGIDRDHTLKRKAWAWCVYGLLLLTPLDSYDPLLTTFRSLPNYFSNSVIRAELSENEYPLLSPKLVGGHLNQTERPPFIFLIIVESLNQSVINKVVTDDRGTREVTPFLNALTKDAVTVKRFYGNSIQTAKGHFATLFSMIPSLKGKAFTKYPDTHIDSIAMHLKRAGYETRFFAAFQDKKFDNTAHFLLKRGFDHYDIVKPYLTKEEAAARFSWGVEDRVYFKRFFDYFESQQHAQKKQPQFYALSTIVNHFPFNSVPESRRFIHSSADSFIQDYENSVHLTDNGIRVFFEELNRRGLLEKSIVVITGDHAFPMGKHGNFHLESGYHEDSFLIPFYLVWKGTLKPGQLDVVASQLDIGPTLLDLIGYYPRNHSLQGHSLFDPQQKVAAIPLIQPYGKHISAIRYPIKYRFYTKSARYYAYDLEKDPMERTSIYGQLPKENRLWFDRYLQRIFLTQKAIERNQVLPVKDLSY